MRIRLKQLKEGFCRADSTFYQTYQNKRVWFFCFLSESIYALLLFAGKELLLWLHLRKIISNTLYKLLIFVQTRCLNLFYYVLILTFVFFVFYLLQDRPISLISCFKKSIGKFRYPLFWSVALLPLILLFLVTTVLIPVLFVPRTKFVESIKNFFRIFIDNFFMIAGFFAYACSLIIFFALLLFALNLGLFVALRSKLAYLSWAKPIAAGLIVFFGLLVSSFVSAMRVFFVVSLLGRKSLNS